MYLLKKVTQYIVKSLKIMDDRTNKSLHWFGADFTLV